MIHGSGPGVSAWANWRLNMLILAEHRRVLAPDMVGFGFTERPRNAVYRKELWLGHLAAFMDAMHIERADFVGNSFGGGLILAFAALYPERVGKMVLMGSVGLSFPLTEGLDAVWGYKPSLEAMRELLDIFAYDRTIVTDELAELRYQASVRAGFQESFARLFPTPRQEAIDALATDDETVASIQQKALIVHGREDRVIPPEVALRLFGLLPNAELHMFGKCGHWTQLEHAHRFNTIVKDFLGPGS
ncbi:MAG: alpha/beta fold hydrolase [Qipengyuania sp.]|nr:alpha/beta fold hydrolase [Qipengyuania sp.]